MKRSLTTICLSAVLLAGSCVSWHGPGIVTTPAGVRLCAKHKTALVTSRGYRLHTERNLHVDPDIDKVERVESCFPNAIPWYESLTPSNTLSNIREDAAIITYCPPCERGAQ